MLRVRDAVFWGLLLWGSGGSAAPPSTAALEAVRQERSRESGRRLTGRFLHITDFHPDPFYKTYSSTSREAACHRGHGPAGVYGAETSACDSPFLLVNETFKWIQDNIKDKIDFVVWTGDSARHDNDEEIPRTQKQVIEQNEFLVAKFAEVFGQTDKHNASMNDFQIPIVPTFGNNDIMPHNIFSKGPNRWTRRYLDIWRSMIPEAQRHQFQQGGWFSVEVIPGKLAVISLNTLYFFNSNSGVDGCADKKEPGYEHMEWLRIQLQFLRTRGMKAILMGHVPPARVNSKESWDETCWQKYTLWTRQFRDVIVGSLYGHMNIDHFMLQDFDQISKEAKRGKMGSSSAKSFSVAKHEATLYNEGELTAASASDYLLDLRQAWAHLSEPLDKEDKEVSSAFLDDSDGEKLSVWQWLLSMVRGRDMGLNVKKNKQAYLDKIGGKFAERYAITHVAPSIVPNYFPTLRIIEYNITGLEDIEIPSTSGGSERFDSPFDQSLINDNAFLDDEEYLRMIETTLKGKKGKKRQKKYKFTVPDGPSKSAPPGPAYSPQTFTFTRVIQYFANLTEMNNDFVAPQQTLDAFPAPQFPMGADSQSENNMDPQTILGLKLSSEGRLDSSRWREGKHNKHQGKKPRSKPHPKEFKFEVEYDTQEDKGFTDLTVRRWIEYARKIGQSGSKSVGFAENELIAGEYEGIEDDDDDFIMDDDDDEQKGYESEQNMKGEKTNTTANKGKRSLKAWNMFVKRAFVGTMDHREIHMLFNTQSSIQASEDALDMVEL